MNEKNKSDFKDSAKFLKAGYVESVIKKVLPNTSKQELDKLLEIIGVLEREAWNDGANTAANEIFSRI